MNKYELTHLTVCNQAKQQNIKPFVSCVTCRPPTTKCLFLLLWRHMLCLPCPQGRIWCLLIHHSELSLAVPSFMPATFSSPPRPIPPPSFQPPIEMPFIDSCSSLDCDQMKNTISAPPLCCCSLLPLLNSCSHIIFVFLLLLPWFEWRNDLHLYSIGLTCREQPGVQDIFIYETTTALPTAASFDSWNGFCHSS